MPGQRQRVNWSGEPVPKGQRSDNREVEESVSTCQALPRDLLARAPAALERTPMGRLRPLAEAVGADSQGIWSSRKQ
jgi:hypothetical protein